MSKPKYVVSTTLADTSEWPNSTLVKGDVAGQLTRLKEQPGKHILALGSATLVRWLLRRGLVGSQAFSTGVVRLTYQPAG